MSGPRHRDRQGETRAKKYGLGLEKYQGRWAIIKQSRATALHVEAEVPFNGVCGLDQVAGLSASRPRLSIVRGVQGTIRQDHIQRTAINPKGIYLLYNNNHFDLITSMAAYTQQMYIGVTNARRGMIIQTSITGVRILARFVIAGNCQTSDEVEDVDVL